MVENYGPGTHPGQPDGPRGLVLLFGVLLVLLVLAPLIDVTGGGGLLLPIVGLLIPLAALRAVSADRKHQVIALVLAAPSLVVAGLDLAGAGTRWLPIVAPLAFFAFATFVIGRAVFRARVVNSEVLAGAACVYLLIGMTCWFGYLAVERFAPGSFAGLTPAPDGPSGTDLLYFSFVTLTTLGYGDIVPIASHVRGLVIAQAVIGILYPAVLIARLVGLYGRSDGLRRNPD